MSASDVENEEGFNIGDEASSTMSDLSKNIEAVFAVTILAIGLVIVGLQLTFDLKGSSYRLVTSTILLFAVIEIPRLRNVSVNIKLIAVSFTTLHAMGVIAILGDGIIQVAAPISLVLLFITTILVTIMEEYIPESIEDSTSP